MKKQSCIICRKPLNDGIMINGRGICRCCEERITKADVETDFYQFYKECIKKNLTEHVLRGVDSSCQNYH